MTTTLDFSIPTRVRTLALDTREKAARMAKNPAFYGKAYRDTQGEAEAFIALATSPGDLMLFDAWLRPEWADLLPRLTGSDLAWAVTHFLHGVNSADARDLYDDRNSDRWDDLPDEPEDDD